LWQQALHTALSLGRNLALPLPLGKWNTTPDALPGWYYRPEENALYHWMDKETMYVPETIPVRSIPWHWQGGDI